MLFTLGMDTGEIYRSVIINEISWDKLKNKTILEIDQFNHVIKQKTPFKLMHDFNNKKNI